MSAAIVWFHLDLRLSDNPALEAAIERGGGVIPVYIWSPEEEGRWGPGAASRWWLHESLKSLEGSLRGVGSRLILRRGPAVALRELIAESGAGAVYWNRRYEPALVERDGGVEAGLRGEGVEVGIFNGTLLHDPAEVRNSTWKAFRVFSAFWRRVVATLEETKGSSVAEKIANGGVRWPRSVRLEEFGLEPKVHWTGGMEQVWRPGEAGAREAVEGFFRGGYGEYSEERNRPDRAGSSRLSPHLHFGEVSVREVVRQLRRWELENGGSANGWRASKFLSEIGWREFAYYLLVHFPDTTDEPLRSEFKNLEWEENPEALRRWERGMTGFPIVDAGMRELWATGWMHNRVRMIVGSFLVKDLLLRWQLGARWFWDTLVDADLANNTLGWQWTAGCGADAAPFFRIFNPVLQGRKFDPEGDYVRKWCPELGRLPSRWIHEPFAAPAAVLEEAGVRLGGNYPEPMVNHAKARVAALAAFDRGVIRS